MIIPTVNMGKFHTHEFNQRPQTAHQLVLEDFRKLKETLQDKIKEKGESLE